MQLNSKNPKLTNNSYPKSLIADLKAQMEIFPTMPIHESSTHKFKKMAGLLLLGICLIMFNYLAYNAFKYSNPPSSIEEIPMVKADHSPVRILPIDPGGEQILNQDKLIYSNLQDPHFKCEKKDSVQIEHEMRVRDADLRMPKQVTKLLPRVNTSASKQLPTAKALPSKVAEAKAEHAKAKKFMIIKNPFEVLDEER